MSFSQEMKLEITENKLLRTRHKKAHAYGLFLFAQAFCAQEMYLRTEHGEVARLYAWLAHSLLGKEAEIEATERQSRGKTVYETKITQPQQRAKLLALFEHTGGIVRCNFAAAAEVAAFLSGAFLSCGNVTDPRKSYHLEFVVKEEALAAALAAVLEETLPGVKRTTRRSHYVLYYKECSQIEDLMTLMSASKSCLVMIDVEMLKSVRNRANRATNCETANIDKLVSAAGAQIEDIGLVLERMGEAALPENLREVARLRMENPDLSLRELAEASPTPISRSGIHHRLDKLSKMAAQLRSQSGK